MLPFQVACQGSLPPLVSCSLHCFWSEVVDKESGVSHLVLSVGSTQGGQDYLNGLPLGAHIRSFTANNVSCSGKERYYVTLRAINNVHLESVAYSKVSSIDMTAPKKGSIHIISSRHGVQLTGNKALVVAGQFVPCWIDASVLTIVWNEFVDPESPVVK